MIRTLKQIITEFVHNRIFYSPVKKLDGQIVLVTGGGRGLGRDIVETLSSKGCTVVTVSRHKHELDHLYSNNPKVTTMQCDVTSETDVSECIGNIVRAHGRIDVLINNVGKYIGGAVEDITPSSFDTVVNTNIRSTYLLTRTVVPYMKMLRSGFIINLGSKVSHNTKVDANKSVYALTKYAVEGFSFALNRELKPWGIRVACLMPGTMRTYLTKDSRVHLSTRSVARFIAAMIELDDIDFESVVIKSAQHDL